MKNVFAMGWLTATAEPVLAKLLCVECKDPETKNIWTTLCMDLVSVRSSSVIAMLSTEQDGITKQTKRVLWDTMAERWASLEQKVEWESAADFLLVPFGFVILSPIFTGF